MNIKELNSILDNIDSLQQLSDEKIEKAVKEYPYFGVAQLLYLKKQHYNNSKFGEEDIVKLPNIAHITDRTVLFQLLYASDTIRERIKRQSVVSIRSTANRYEELAEKAKSLQNRKASISADDQNNINDNQPVSESLAQIFCTQKHYKKAIDIYKKLSLKYPEKSTYFAAQILSLEKSIENESEGTQK